MSICLLSNFLFKITFLTIKGNSDLLFHSHPEFSCICHNLPAFSTIMGFANLPAFPSPTCFAVIPTNIMFPLMCIFMCTIKFEVLKVYLEGSGIYTLRLYSSFHCVTHMQSKLLCEFFVFAHHFGICDPHLLLQRAKKMKCHFLPRPHSAAGDSTVAAVWMAVS